LKRRDLLLVLQPVLDRNTRTSLCDQLSHHIARAIHNGELADGDYLPSTRLMAKHLGISRNTVLQAYEELVAVGLIVGVPGSGMRVCQGTEVVPTAIPSVELQRIVRAARFPARIISLTDQDGNPLYFNY